MKGNSHIRAVLDSAYVEYHSQIEKSRDPIVFPHRYSQAEDKEVVAFFSALLAYGNVRSILNSLELILAPLGKNPKLSILQSEKLDHWNDFTHRFTKGIDISILAYWIKSSLLSHGSLENFFIDHPTHQTSSMKDLLSSFIRRFTSQKLPPHLKIHLKSRERNLKYLLSDPERGSACKRLNLFLRWVVRPEDGIDLGVWKKIAPDRLMLPIDTHLLQTLKKLRWTRSKTANWKVVEASTAKLRSLCPEDPIKYDFSLCHLSMRGGSLKKYSPGKTP